MKVNLFQKSAQNYNKNCKYANFCGTFVQKKVRLVLCGFIDQYRVQFLIQFLFLAIP